MSRIGTVSMGIRMPVIRQGDDLCEIVTENLLAAVEEENIQLHDKDVVAITESIVARAQGNYATTDQIAKAVREKFPQGEAAVIFPILSRNRFSVLLRGILKGLDKVIIALSYPSDEVGNHLMDADALLDAGINPYTTVMNLEEFRSVFGSYKHPFTGVDYVDFYQNLGDNVELMFTNDPCAVLSKTSHCLVADIHSRRRTKRRLTEAGAQTVVGIDELLNESVDGSGFNPEYGLLGSNLASEEKVKLFPRDCRGLVADIQAKLFERTGKKLEVMVYGDGAFKDPVGGIWELADPVVSPAYTSGLSGMPNEIKFKFVADNQLSHLSGIDAEKAMQEY
ncbi:MAG: F420-0--gamma-glutamyl ligase, partial [Clostridiales bacterium]|nr:F420-0--gamma-glutamyl ligase [Clostridiales bacterium]